MCVAGTKPNAFLASSIIWHSHDTHKDCCKLPFLNAACPPPSPIHGCSRIHRGASMNPNAKKLFASQLVENALLTFWVCRSCSSALALASTCVGGNLTPAAIAAVKNGQTRSGRGETGEVCSLQTFDPLNDAVRSTGTRGATPLSAKLPKMPAIFGSAGIPGQASKRIHSYDPMDETRSGLGHREVRLSLIGQRGYCVNMTRIHRLLSEDTLLNTRRYTSWTHTKPQLNQAGCSAGSRREMGVCHL